MLKHFFPSVISYHLKYLLNDFKKNKKPFLIVWGLNVWTAKAQILEEISDTGNSIVANADEC